MADAVDASMATAPPDAGTSAPASGAAAATANGDAEPQLAVPSLQQVLPASGAAGAPAPAGAHAQPAETSAAPSSAEAGQPLGEAQSDDNGDAALIAPPAANAAGAAMAAHDGAAGDNAAVEGGDIVSGDGDGDDLLDNEGLIEGDEEGGDTVLALYDKVCRTHCVLSCSSQDAC